MQMVQAKKQRTYQSLKKELDKVFSCFIRLRDCYATTGTYEHGRCITCGRYVEYKGCDAGHYIKRQHMATRWNEHNVNLQCKYENAFEQGADVKYRAALRVKYGPDVPDILTAMSKRVKRYYTYELEAMIEYYKDKIRLMVGERM